MPRAIAPFNFPLLWFFNLPRLASIVKITSAFGVSPSGKARDFDSRIRRFDPCHPSHQLVSPFQKARLLAAVLLTYPLPPMKTRFLPSRRAFWLGTLGLALIETFASLVRAHFLPATPFFQIPALYIGLPILKSLVFGPILTALTLQIAALWRQKAWDEACYKCLRGGFTLCAIPASFALACFLFGARFPLFAWLSLSWVHFALWLTLNASLIWALLLVVAGFLLPHDAKKTIRISEEVRF